MSKYNFSKPNRKVNRVFLHCSASDHENHDDVSVMRDWHVNGRKWSDVGYHLFIKKSGEIQKGRDLERIPCSARGHNTGTIAICCHGLKKDKFTQKQFNSVYELCNQINIVYDGRVSFHGHVEVANKSCPVYDYKGVLNLDGDGKMVLDSKIGDRVLEMLVPYGRDVAWVQEKLECSPVDGLFGRITEAAVKKFQEDYGETIDGIVGYKTFEVLFDVFGDPND
ncbi:MAG: peptidoglycan-binding domain-containing protein [Proteobacteria bacterium]|nr:peptidoglycan-binding domain-containing protein [Pseudomonadota bacterium]